MPAPSASPRPHARRAAPDEAELASRLRLAIARLHRQLRQTGGTDLTPTQLSLLATVEQAGPVTLGELAALERVAPPSISRSTAKLVRRGLLERRADAVDRRVARVEISRDGRRLLAEGRIRRNAWLAGRLRELPAKELARLAAAVEVLERLAGQPGAPGAPGAPAAPPPGEPGGHRAPPPR